MNVMSDTAIQVKDLAKLYRLGSYTVSRKGETLYDLLSRGLSSPFRRRINIEKEEQDFWALQDVSFEVPSGQVLGIIGRNGAGKSTLLKILSRITDPTRGRIEIRGRVASLLEIGTGFHPELTGRENIYLNGAILGMRRREIDRKFSEIASFADVEVFLDTPVKRYSSGMYVRLAFAVAAFLEPDVLLVDEVLAVGDTAFQRKCLGKMEETAREGRTVLFVSHNLGAVRTLCQSALLLDAGRIAFRGEVEETLSLYESRVASRTGDISPRAFQGPLADRFHLHEISYRQDGRPVSAIDPERELTIEVQSEALRSFHSFDLTIALYRDGVHLASCHDAPQGAPVSAGPLLSRIRIPPRVLRPGRYTVSVGAVGATGDWIWGSDLAALDVMENWGDRSSARDRGAVCLPYSAERTQ